MKGVSAAVVARRKRKPDYCRKTERLLYDYKTYDSAIRNLKAELESIMPNASTWLLKFGGGSTTAPFESQTEEWAIKRIESPRAQRIVKLLAEKKRLKRAVKEAREQLTDEENTLVWMRYDLEKPHQEIWKAMHMSRANYFRLKNEIIEKISRYLGFL